MPLYALPRQYVDELVQIGVNQDPGNANTATNAENLCERFFWVFQDANFNVLGVVNSSGSLVEIVEIVGTPYSIIDFGLDIGTVVWHGTNGASGLCGDAASRDAAWQSPAADVVL